VVVAIASTSTQVLGGGGGECGGGGVHQHMSAINKLILLVLVLHMKWQKPHSAHREIIEKGYAKDIYG
jgi:hypothetical protein